MNSNMLQLNMDNTEFNVFSSKQDVKKTENVLIKVDLRFILKFYTLVVAFSKKKQNYYL